MENRVSKAPLIRILQALGLNDSTILRILFRGNLPQFLAAISVGVLGTGLESLSILSLGPLFKAIHDGKSFLSIFGHSIPLSIAFPILAAIIPTKIGLVLLSKHIPTLVATRVNALVRMRILKNLIWSDTRWKGRLNIADTIKRVDDGVYWTTASFQHGVTIISCSLSLMALFLIMFRISPLMSLASLGFFAIMAISTRFLNRNAAKTASEVSRNSSAFYEHVCDAAQAYPVIRTFDAAALFQQRAGERIDSLRKNEVKVCQNLRSLGYTNEFFAFFFLLFNIFFLWAGWFQISFSAFMVFFYASYRAIQSLKEIAYESANLIKCREHAALVDPLLDMTSSAEPESGVRLPKMKRALEVHKLTFAYPKGEAVLRALDLTLHAGEKLAIVGESGCGKSTLLSILIGMTHPRSGSIKVDGKEVRPGTLLSSLGLFIPQESHVFKLTLAENVALSGEFDPVRVEIALRQANLGSLLDSLPGGIHTPIGNFENGLSAGQKQRLAIARTLYRGFDVLFMDEPNSSLDAGNSRQVMREVFTLFQDKTIVVVTHDDTMLPYFDRVLTLRDGKLFPSHPRLSSPLGYRFGPLPAEVSVPIGG